MYNICGDCESESWTCPYIDTYCPVCGNQLNKEFINIGGMVGWGPDPPEYVYKITCPKGCLIRDAYEKEKDNFLQ